MDWTVHEGEDSLVEIVQAETFLFTPECVGTSWSSKAVHTLQKMSGFISIVVEV